jgi:hypothetical protein
MRIATLALALLLIATSAAFAGKNSRDEFPTVRCPGSSCPNN